METDYPQHFHLPLYAEQCITSVRVKEQYRVWLYKLHGAYSALRLNDEEMAGFEEQLESARREALLQFTEELNSRCADARRTISALRQCFSTELRSAFKEVITHAMEEWSPEANYFAWLIWNYDGVSSLMVFNGSVGRTKERLTEAFNIHMETALPAFARFNIDQYGLQDNIESIRSELAAERKRVEELKTEKENLLRKNEEYQASIVNLNEALADLANTNEAQLKQFAAEKETLMRESAAQTKRLTEQTETQKAEIKRLADDFERIQLLLESAAREQDIPGHILPQIHGNTLKRYKLLTGETSAARLTTIFSNCTVFCLLTEDSVLCVGGSDGFDSLATTHLLELSTAKAVLQQPMGIKRSVPGIIKRGSFVYVFGGFTGCNFYLKSCEKFSMAERSWSELSDMQHERSAFAPCAFGDDIYLSDVSKSHRVLESFNVVTERFKILLVSIPNVFNNGSVSFIVNSELIIICHNGQMGKWRIEAESKIRVSAINLNGVVALSNVPPIQRGKKVFWVQFDSGNLAKFDLNSHSISL